MSKAIIIFLLFILLGSSLLFGAYYFSSEANYSSEANGLVLDTKENTKPKITHIKTPENVRAVYMSACYASAPSLREKLVKLIEDTELNSIVIDIKDYTGTVSFQTGDTEIDSLDGSGCKVSNMENFVRELHKKDIYVVGRVTVFQDPLYTKVHPELAVKKKSNIGVVWKDRKGLSFIDVGARPFWDYIVKIATSSYAVGFDEINFDYIRFPSDGNMNDIVYTHTGTTTKKEMLRQFFEYLDQKLSDKDVVTSADLFGMTTTNTDDLNIGQVLEYALMNFDYVSPMVYPSHYPPNFNGWKDPNKVPAELIKYVLGAGVARIDFLNAEIASTSPNSKLVERIDRKQLRPWLQDFDYPVAYTPAMVRGQIQSTYDVGLNSWMLWDPSNQYTREALILDAVPARP